MDNLWQVLLFLAVLSSFGVYVQIKGNKKSNELDNLVAESNAIATELSELDPDSLADAGDTRIEPTMEDTDDFPATD